MTDIDKIRTAHAAWLSEWLGWFFLQQRGGEMKAWMIERKAKNKPPAWWCGGKVFSDRSDFGWTENTNDGIKFADVVSATATHVALIALARMCASEKQRHLSVVTVTEHEWPNV